MHTRRIRWVLGQLDRRQGDHRVRFLLQGASDHSYEEARWWEYEKGLIFVNNEYLKLLYYIWRY
jgi:hypothetical protein